MIVKLSNGLERHMWLRPGYDAKGEGAGIHNAELNFAVKGPMGAVTFMIYTNWYTKSARAGMESGYIRDDRASSLCKLDVHSKVPQGEWDTEPTSKQCDWTDGGECYCSGSMLQRQLADGLVEFGEEWLFEELEKEYEQRLKNSFMAEI